MRSPACDATAWSAAEMPLDLDRVIQTATEAFQRPFIRSPQYRSEALSRLLGVEVILKVETAQPDGDSGESERRVVVRVPLGRALSGVCECR